ncbi:MAG: HAD family hydrolase [Dehalococcoidia bacterium]
MLTKKPSEKPLKAIFFDAYGTLFHYEPEKLSQTFSLIVAQLGLNVAPDTLLDRWRIYEKQFRETRVLFTGGVWVAPGEFTSYKKAWISCFKRAYEYFGQAEVSSEESVNFMLEDLNKREIFADVRQTLNHLSNTVSVSVISNADSDFLSKSIENNGLIFDKIICSETERVYKPHPSIFQAALDYFGIDAGSSMYVGDSPLEDIQGPQSLGMNAIWLNRNGTDWPEGFQHEPAYEVSNLKEIIEIVDSINN